MLYYEVKKACGLSTEARPSKAVYRAKSTATQICQTKNIQLTNQWIWSKITNNGQKQIDGNSNTLCTKVTNDAEALRLSRFFYKIAPRIRQADSKRGKVKKINVITKGSFYWFIPQNTSVAYRFWL